MTAPDTGASLPGLEARLAEALSALARSRADTAREFRARLHAEDRTREALDALRPFADYVRAVDPANALPDEAEAFAADVDGSRKAIRVADFRRAAALAPEGLTDADESADDGPRF